MSRKLRAVDELHSSFLDDKGARVFDLMMETPNELSKSRSSTIYPRGQCFELHKHIFVSSSGVSSQKLALR
ncbi:hypothetical protein VOM14_30980 [Paraburkholderia sp. MPAMCS5]|uniref:hypothetical protein n=1 Tax=Paraburkholderia sp. MPAMCS5 TaxID=3112563 RepID=UPI002E175ABC|nr:hypothetical protein [Paraburkholderia sp. MPAMCS5]